MGRVRPEGESQQLPSRESLCERMGSAPLGFWEIVGGVPLGCPMHRGRKLLFIIQFPCHWLREASTSAPQPVALQEAKGKLRVLALGWDGAVCKG